MAREYENAIEYFAKCLEFDLDERLTYVIDCVETYGYALINSGNSEIAREVLGREEVYKCFSSRADFCFMIALAYMNCEEYDRAIREFQKCIGKDCCVDGTNSYRAYYNIGVIYECLGNKKEALAYYNKCGGYEPANVGKRRTLAIR